ncbi:putative biopolymer transport protein, ExbD/TolR family [Crocosphaera subtropica ATCC 51142]|uniref:Biopolymer transport protein, ExbD/TolR family n=1 Tax=Crocosphaera subtropica (strain ATCC 51142 / BH68) TaxID=43989 RepID=B1WWT2_CROS5|nr:biopolymer transporter ExbD [Crocosphaera subtropica]ACB52401.1 putative biopolymer transport protein, ExbD/TolR family [Crocosphaera subtropica ATCC 51142]
MQLPDEMDTPAEINIVPMIDIIFSILAFVIISTLFLTRSEGLPVNLPSAQSTEPQKTQQINVTVEADGDIFVDRQPTEVNDLKNAISGLMGQAQESLVIINADKAVEHGRVVAVMDKVRQVQGAKLAIAATKSD